MRKHLTLLNSFKGRLKKTFASLNSTLQNRKNTEETGTNILDFFRQLLHLLKKITRDLKPKPHLNRLTAEKDVFT